MKSDKISELTTNRLSVYLRCLNEIYDTGAKTVSSKALADRFHLNSAQIRKDLAYFGEFGVRGVGYMVESLRDHLTRILGLDKEHRVGIIGAGRLGMALTDYYGFRKANFKVAALFDADPKKIGKKAGSAEVKERSNTVRGTVGPLRPTAAPRNSVLVTINRTSSATAMVAMLK